MSRPAPGRYCLAVCYCRQCDHYVPIKRTADRDDLTTTTTTKSSAWDAREESTWIDKL